MAIQMRVMLHFVNFFASKFNLSGQRSLLPRLRPPGMAKRDRSSALPNISLSDINLFIRSSDP